jgi:hypothetical protein
MRDRIQIITVLLTFLCLHAFNVNAQCILSGLSPTYCINSNPSNLSTNYTGGLLTGAGVVNSVFQPALAGVGIHTISYAYCSNGYSLETETFSPFPYNPAYVTLGDNEMSSILSIGFTFNFFCNNYSSFYISSNGFITFSPQQANGCCQGQPMPTSGVNSQNMIACAWTDLDPSVGGTIQYVTMGSAPSRSLLISFNCIFHKNAQGPVTSYIILHESTNIIEICTTTKPIPSGPNLYPTTMGIQNGSGLALVVPGRNGTSNWTATNEVCRFIPGPNCSTTQTTQVYANPIVTAASSKSLICDGESTVLTASGSSTYSWNSGQTGSNISVAPTTLTHYTVIGTSIEGCSSSAMVSVKVSGCSGIENHNKSDENQLFVYPNPSAGQFKITSTVKTNIEIYNNLGSIIARFELSKENGFTTVVEDLSKGVYLVSARNNSFTQFKKLIINN